MVSHRRLGRKPTYSQAMILDAACMLFAEKGYHNTTMDDIARATGLTKGGVYHYLENKEDVLYLLHDGFIKEGLGRLEPIVQSDLPARDKLIELMRAHLQLLHDRYRQIRLFFREMHVLSGEKYETIRGLRAQYEQYFVQTIEQCVAQGLLRAEEPAILARFILGAVNWMLVWYKPDGRLGPEDLARLLIDMVLDGVAQPSEGQTTSCRSVGRS